MTGQNTSVLIKALRWDTLMEKLSRRLKRIFNEHYPLATDADRTPEVLALQDFILDFPFPTRILRIEAGADSPTTMKKRSTLVRFDFTKPRSSSADFHGSVSEAEIKSRREFLSIVFGIQRIDAMQNMQPCFSIDSDGQHLVDFVPFDISDDLDTYASGLFTLLLDRYYPHIQARYRSRHIEDFNKKYNLKPDPIFTKDELFSTEPGPLVDVRTGQPPSIEHWQQDVADFQLIPTVPESVQSTFRAAKQLYVFGYFQWRFFTVGLHYACLAMEAAVKHRWAMSLPEDVKVEYSNGVTNSMRRPAYELLYRHWRNDKDMKVDGKPFPNSMPRLIRALRKKKLILSWEAQRIEECIDERNNLSHLEMATVMPPWPSRLRDVAELTNLMFDRVPS